MEREHHEIDAGIEGFSSGDLSDQERADSLKRAIDALRRHIYLEEEFLFPPMSGDLAIPTMVMLREHGEIWQNLNRIEAMLEEDGSGDSLTEACRQVLVQLEVHNEKEEPIFYEQADQTLSPAESSELMNLIETSQMPNGWICRKATAA